MSNMSELQPPPPTSGRNRSVPWWLVTLGAFVALVIGIGAALVITNDDGRTTDGPQQLVLEPIGTSGDDPFTVSVATEEVAVLTSVSAPAGEGGAPLEVAGNQPGLYGGTRDETACDAAALVTYLEENPAKAAAWADVVDIAPAGIRDFVASLTPVLLRTDTRVTNHGFASGVATPRQSVLQAGTAVLVDTFGMPRVRCSCGNPLTEPAPLPGQLPAATTDGDVVLVGQPWQTWNPAVVVVVNATVEVNEFVIFDIETEQEYTQPVGSDTEANPINGKVVVTRDGLQVLDDAGALVDTIAIDTPIAEVTARLEPYIGQPTAVNPPDPSAPSYCSFASTQWGELALIVSGDTFIRWSVSAGKVDFQTGAFEPYEVLGIVQTEQGIILGATQEEVRAANPSVTTSPSAPGAPFRNEWLFDRSDNFDSIDYLWTPDFYDGLTAYSLELPC